MTVFDITKELDEAYQRGLEVAQILRMRSGAPAAETEYLAWCDEKLVVHQKAHQDAILRGGNARTEAGEDLCPVS